MLFILVQQEQTYILSALELILVQVTRGLEQHMYLNWSGSTSSSVRSSSPIVRQHTCALLKSD